MKVQNSYAITKTIYAIRGERVTDCRSREIRVGGILFHYTQISPPFKGKLAQVSHSKSKCDFAVR